NGASFVVSEGQTLLAFYAANGGGNQIYVKNLTSPGTVTLTLGTVAQNNTSPTIAATQGGAGVAWLRTKGSANDLVFQKLTFGAGHQLVAESEVVLSVPGRVNTYGTGLAHIAENLWFV